MPSTEYDQQAADFVAATGLTIKSEYVGHDQRMGQDVPTAHFRVTFEREGRKPWTFDYSDSIADSYQWADDRDARPLPKWGRMPQSVYGKVEAGSRRTPDDAMRDAAAKGNVGWARYRVRKCVPTPTAYDLLSCVTKSDPGAFSEFCREYGYNEDSIKDRDIWQAVCEEWASVRRMFTEAELEKLSEIQ